MPAAERAAGNREPQGWHLHRMDPGELAGYEPMLGLKGR